MYFRRIADLRIDKDYKQKEIASILNVHPEVYRRYEKGIREIPVWALIKLAQLYGTSTDYILGLTDDPSKPHA
ncbi:MAG: helix-turn-helix domain-containing protein [Oscillospiraceae bacterium]